MTWLAVIHFATDEHLLGWDHFLVDECPTQDEAVAACQRESDCRGFGALSWGIHSGDNYRESLPDRATHFTVEGMV